MSDIFWFYYGTVWLTCMLIVIIFLLRLLLRNQSKVITGLLWIFLLVRLLCPLTLKSDFGLIPEDVNVAFSIDRDNDETDFADTTTSYSADKAVGFAEVEAIDGATAELGNADSEVAVLETENKNKIRNVYDILPIVWLAGIIVLAIMNGLYSLILYRKKRYAVRIPERKNVYEWPDVTNACVLGVVHPKIYVPTGLDEKTLDNILLHERMHIKRWDHITSVFYRIALWLNWLNPLCWVAYFRYRADVELACDEQALRHKGVEARRSYANTLLSMGIAKETKEAFAISFNKGSLKKRIIHAGKEHKVRPSVATIVSILCMILLASTIFVKDAGARFEALKREIAKEKFSESLPKICYADENTLIFYDYHGVFVYDLKEQELCGYASFEENGIDKVNGRKFIKAFASADGKLVYVIANNGKQYKYDVLNDTFGEEKYDIEKLSIWNSEIDTGIYEEEIQYYNASLVYRLNDETYCYFIWDLGEKRDYSTLCFVMNKEGKKESYYIFQ